VLVCSDAMTRGMDVENAANVVSYDAPVYAKVRQEQGLLLWT
jgi:superfamily II DNA/RNA helicase